MEQDDINFDAHLTSTWNNYFEKSKNPQDPKVYHEQSQYWEIGPEHILAFYN